MLYQIFHCYDVDGGFGDAVPEEDIIATVDATPEEIEAFLKEWDHPRIYDRPYGELWEHHICATCIEVTHKLSELQPYNPEEKTMPSLPSKENLKPGYSWHWENGKYVAMKATFPEGLGHGITWIVDETAVPEEEE